MQAITVVIRNKVGLHARPASLFVQAANKFQSAITIQNLTTNSTAVNAKSILMVLTLGAEREHSVKIAADGVDESAALAAMNELFDHGFSEIDEPGNGKS